MKAARPAPKAHVLLRLAGAELAGTALLVLVGLSLVILDFGAGSPVLRWIPSPDLRRLVTGFLFGATGATIAISPIGKASGAHINPLVTLAFYLKGTLHRRHAVAYVVAQCVGAVLGCVPLLAFGAMGRSVDFGATVPGAAGPGWALAGEVVTTFALVALLFFFLGARRLRPFTPLLFPFLYAFMVWAEAPLSGTSTNTARTLGPAVVAWDWTGFWVYVVGPLIGTLLALWLHAAKWLDFLEVEVAKVYHFASDRHGVFRAAVAGASTGAPPGQSSR